MGSVHEISYRRWPKNNTMRNKIITDRHSDFEIDQGITVTDSLPTLIVL